ncbi:unnamed protein product [Allacma fusca]|uniref:Uncharacterized protein n=2 Tax=Allacma fusca TaxID=39272 RepID=A0A8J2KDE5_9HEXA|nr:unnamed protein product [Allacma fusca]
MSKSNAIFPAFGETPPVTSQPASRQGKAHLTRMNKDDDGVKLPTPRTFLTPEECPPGLDSLIDPEYVFMKQSFHAFDGKNLFVFFLR